MCLQALVSENTTLFQLHAYYKDNSTIVQGNTEERKKKPKVFGFVPIIPKWQLEASLAILQRPQ